MKTSKTFRLSEEAIEVLDAQSNATQFLEDLLLTSRVPQNQTTGGLTKEEVLDLIKSTILTTPPATPLTTGAEFIPKPPDPDKGYPCCSGRTPCKHWVWDDMNTEWKNSLTGKTREA